MHRSFLKRFPLLFGFCLPSLRCLISTLTQAGGADLLFRFASSVQSCCGEGGALQADVAVCGDHSPSSGHTGFAPYRGVCAFPVYTAQAPGCSIRSRPCVECGSSFQVLHKSAGSVASSLCLLRPERFRQPGAWVPSPLVRCAFSLQGPSTRCLRLFRGVGL